MTLDPSWSRPRAYPTLGDGTIPTHSLEVHVTDHCNLRCAGCCVLSPLAPRHFLEAALLERDLAWAREVLRPSIFKLSGGEPLLAPNIVELARVAKASGIAPRVSMTTNGVLLARAPDALFEELDAITVSIYPGVGIDAASLAALRDRAVRFGVALNEKRQDEFQSMTRRSVEPDSAATREVFDTCWLRHRCHTLRDGTLFACSRPIGLDALAGAGGSLAASDGISLAPRAELAREITSYLERSEPLASCARCLGGTGALMPFRQLTRTEVRERRPE
jgi:organic radical activating enzyme